MPAHPWTPAPGFKKDPNWPDAPSGWNFWVELTDQEKEQATYVGEIDDRSRPRSVEEEELRMELEDRLIALDDRLLLQEAGIYDYHHPLENALAYQDALAAQRERIAETIKDGKAVSFAQQFVFENSISKGQRFARDLSSLALHSFNQEVENTLRTLKPGTLGTAKKRIEMSALRISRLGRLTELEITREFINLRIEELELTADYLQKVKDERDAQRDARERLREEQKALKELEAQREKLQKEKSHYENALDALRAKGNLAEAAALESRLRELEGAIEQNDYRMNNVRAGYVYVISNEGAFGPGVVKIGMTRRLDPMDRVVELGDASVPFRYAVHALFFSDDAVGLETTLHSHFSEKRVNVVNARKEFFFATPAQVKGALKRNSALMLEFDEGATNEDFLVSAKVWESQRGSEAKLEIKSI